MTFKLFDGGVGQQSLFLGASLTIHEDSQRTGIIIFVQVMSTVLDVILYTREYGWLQIFTWVYCIQASST